MPALKVKDNDYSYKREITPFPEGAMEKKKPPAWDRNGVSTCVLPAKKELSMEEQAQQYMDDYRKYERFIIVNFYTGGNKYSRGMIDAIYRGVNF